MNKSKLNHYQGLGLDALKPVDLGLGVADALKPVDLGLGVADALKPVDLGLGVADALKPVDLGLGVADALKPVDLGLGVADALKPVDLGLGVADALKPVDLGLGVADALKPVDLGVFATDAFKLDIFANTAFEKMNASSRAAEALESISASNRIADAFENLSKPLLEGFDFATLSASGGLNVDNLFKAAERQAANIASMVSIPDTYQLLVEQIASAKENSLKDTGSSIKELYDASVVELSKDIFSEVSENASTKDDKDNEPSQLLIGSALILVSGFIDEESANDQYFIDSIIDAEQFFDTRTDTDEDSPDEIIEAICEWIRDTATLIKDDMTPNDAFSYVLALVLFSISMVYAWYLNQ